MNTRASALFTLGCAALALCAVTIPAHALILQTTTADAAVLGPNGNNQDGNGTGVAALNVTTARAGSNSASAAGSIGKAYVIPFQLPTLAAGQTISTASLSVFYAANGGVGGVVGTYPDGTAATFDADLYGLTNHASNSSAVLATDYYQGALDSTNATLLQDNILAPGTQPADGTAIASSGTALATFLQSQYNLLGAGAFVFLRLNADADSGATGNFAYNFFTFDQGTVNGNSVIPTINYTVVPEPGTTALLALGGVVALGSLARRCLSVA